MLRSKLARICAVAVTTVVWWVVWDWPQWLDSVVDLADRPNASDFVKAEATWGLRVNDLLGPSASAVIPWVVTGGALLVFGLVGYQSWAQSRQAQDANHALRQSLGNLLLDYERLEREYRSKGWSIALSRKQTALHNRALPVTRRLGPEYYAQFKRERKRPAIVPETIAANSDHLNLLDIIHGRAEWISKTIDELKPKR
jgi:hypothetical protein